MSTLLDDCLASETPEEALEHLLSITTTSDIASMCLVTEQSLHVLCELWRRWQGRGDVCMVIVRVFVELVVATSGGSAAEEWRDNVREFAQQLVEHG